jgi:hypothetical protein
MYCSITVNQVHVCKRVRPQPPTHHYPPASAMVQYRVDRESAKVKWSDTILDSVHHWWNVLKG